MEKTVMVETSARHVHVTEETLEILFGKGYQLTKKKDLSQPGQFACEERVQVIGPKNSFPAVSILGPTRPADQVELSASDARSIGVAAPVRESGDIAGSGACKLVGPKGEVELKDGVKDKQVVSVKIDSPERSLVFGDVVVRVSPKFKLAMHIDTDESNAVMAGRDATGVIVD